MKDPQAVQRFGQLLHERFGLRPDPARLADLASALSARLAAHAEQPEAYFERLLDPRTAPAELRAISTLVTIGETYFFRHPDQFRALAEVALPDRARQVAGLRPLRVLSAGCSSGEEPYTIAMLVDGRPELLAGATLQLEGIDLNPNAIARARAGRYTAWSLRGVDPLVQARYLKPEGAQFQVVPAILERVKFEERNLVAEDLRFWRRESFDLIICRNVLIYFDATTIKALIDVFARALVPGGYLFLGPAETLRGISDDFHLLHTHGCFYYQRKGALVPRDMQPALPMPLLVALPLPQPPAPVDDWAAAIAAAADRIAALAIVKPSAPPAEAAWERVLEAAKHERFGEALAALDALPSARSGDRDARLLRAAILTNMGRLAEAEAACRAAIAQDEQDPGAHYLFALCREQAGDATGARPHDEAALYLDPTFAMPWLHLGLLAARTGDRPAAREAFTRARALLPGEPAERLDLFAGGFTRGTLLGLVEGELARLGDAS